MDPSQLDGVSVIVGALAAGAGDGLKDVTKGAVTGAAYSVGQGLHAARDKLAGLLKSRFHGNEDAAADLNVYLRRPTPENAEPLAGHILQAGLDHDQQILTAARRLLDAAGPTAIGPGSIAAESISQINKGGGDRVRRWAARASSRGLHTGSRSGLGARPHPWLGVRASQHRVRDRA